MKKLVLVFMYISCIVLAFVNKEYILTWIQEKDTTDMVPLIVLATILALFPVIPYGVIAGIIGAKFGTVSGGLVNVIASTIAAMRYS